MQSQPAKKILIGGRAAYLDAFVALHCQPFILISLDENRLADLKAVNALIRGKNQHILGQHGKVFKFHMPSPPELPNDIGLTKLGCAKAGFFRQTHVNQIRLFMLPTQGLG